MNPWMSGEGNSSLPALVTVEQVMLCLLFKQHKCTAVTVEMGEWPDFITNFTFQVTSKFSYASCWTKTKDKFRELVRLTVVKDSKKMNDILRRVFFCHLSSLHISLFLLYFPSLDHQGSHVSLGSLGLCLVPDRFCCSQIFMMTAWNFWNALVSYVTIVRLSLKK